MTDPERPLRIVFAAPAYWPAEAFGGPIPVMRELASGLVARGHEVDVITTSLTAIGAAPARRTRVAGVDGARVRYLATPLRFRWMGLTPTLPLVLARIGRPDVVHVFGFRDPLGTAVATWCRLRSVPYVFEALGMFRPKLRKVGLKRVLDGTVLRHVPGGAAVVVAASRREEREYTDGGVDRARVVIRPNGFPPVRDPAGDGVRGRLGLPDGAPLVLSVGRVASGKGIELLVDALPGLPGTHLVVAGPDDGHGTAAELRRRGERTGVGDRVHLLGPLPRAEVDALYACAGVLALPSAHENFGMVAAEAASAGLPVVVSDRCGVAELLGDAALVVPYEGEAVAAAVARVLGDGALRERLSWAGREVARRYAWPAIVDEQEHIYRLAIGRA